VGNFANKTVEGSGVAECTVPTVMANYKHAPHEKSGKTLEGHASGPSDEEGEGHKECVLGQRVQSPKAREDGCSIAQQIIYGLGHILMENALREP